MVSHNDIQAYLDDVEKQAAAQKADFEIQKSKLEEQLDALTDEFNEKEAVLKAKIEACNKLLEKDQPEVETAEVEKPTTPPN